MMWLKLEQTTTDINFDGSVTMRIPIRVRIKSGRKFIMTPGGAELEYATPKPSDPMINAIVKAHHWKDQLEAGKVSSLSAIAKNEKITDAYISRVYRLTLLAPDIVEAILAGTQPKTLTLLDMFKPFPLLWAEQRKRFGLA